MYYNQPSGNRLLYYFSSFKVWVVQKKGYRDAIIKNIREKGFALHKKKAVSFNVNIWLHIFLRCPVCLWTITLSLYTCKYILICRWYSYTLNLIEFYDFYFHSFISKQNKNKFSSVVVYVKNQKIETFQSIFHKNIIIYYAKFEVLLEKVK